MRKQGGISIIVLIIIVAVVAGCFFVFNSSKSSVKMNWGDFIQAPEYYELKIAALKSELYGSGVGILSKASFNTLGRDVKKAKGKWFKNNNINFRAKSEEVGNFEVVSLTDGDNIATFTYDTINGGVNYTFKRGSGLGYRITIK